MKPYLVHKTWVDLDYVVAISAEVQHSPYISCAENWLCSFSESAMLRDRGTLDFSLADGGKNWSSDYQAEILKEAQARLDAFIAAWKARDDPMPHGSGNSHRDALIVKAVAEIKKNWLGQLTR